MIEVILKLGSETILIVVRGKEVKFGNTAFGTQVADISGLKLNYQGVCREFPDLETNDDWREEAIRRFKEKINEMTSETQISEYVIKELKKHGYVPYLKRRAGFRPTKL